MQDDNKFQSDDGEGSSPIMFDWFNLYPCDPDKNAECRKDWCFANFGPCKYTTNYEYEKELYDMTQLESMLSMQREFQMRLDPKFLDMTIKERVAFIKEHSIHLNQEVNEMLYELPYFKPWKDYSGLSTEAEAMAMAKARMECIDAWHFFMNIMIALGFSADEFVEMYMAKHKENNRRQDDGYTADVSYRDQSVEEVMNNG